MIKRISDKYLEEQKILHQKGNYGIASLGHAQTIKNLMIEANFKTLCDYGAGKKTFKRD